MECPWCRSPLEQTVMVRGGHYCSRKCRQAAWRLRRRRTTEASNDRPMRFVYADPPYPGTAKRYYGAEASYGGEVDHEELVSLLERRRAWGSSTNDGGLGIDGWALSTSAKALRVVLPICPPETRVCAWTKPGGVPPGTRGPHNVWEPLLVVGGRPKQPGTRDALVAHAARLGGTLPGRKPIAFIAWAFDLLGMEARDELEDWFPGSRIVGASAVTLGMTLGDSAWPSTGQAGVLSGPPRPPSEYAEAIRESRINREEILDDTIGGFFEASPSSPDDA